MTVSRIAAFAPNDTTGGNPAGVLIADALPAPEDMQRIAAEVGYSETVFAAPQGEDWIVRYYAPEAEVDFCGHATIALGAELGARHGAGIYRLHLRNGEAAVAAQASDAGWTAELTSPETWSEPLDPALLKDLLDLFEWSEADLDPRITPSLGFAGARHAILPLASREKLAGMTYDFDTGRALMLAHGLVTINMIHIAGDRHFDSRNAFAFGGVVEDPATGAAAAALGGALVDQDFDGLAQSGSFTITQGEDMGAPSHLTVTVTGTKGDRVRVSGRTRTIAS